MKCPNSYSAEQIQVAIEAGGEAKKQMIEGVIQSLSQCESLLRTVVALVRNKGRNVSDAEDLLQDSLIQLIKNLNLGKFSGQSSIENYTIGIFKNKLANFITKKKEQLVALDVNPDQQNIKHSEQHIFQRLDTIIPENQIIETEKKKILEDIVNQLGGRCPDLLKHWSLGFSFRETAEAFGMSEKKVNTRTYECRERLRELITNNLGYQNMLNSIRFDL